MAHRRFRTLPNGARSRQVPVTRARQAPCPAWWPCSLRAICPCSPLPIADFLRDAFEAALEPTEIKEDFSKRKQQLTADRAGASTQIPSGESRGDPESRVKEAHPSHRRVNVSASGYASRRRSFPPS